MKVCNAILGKMVRAFPSEDDNAVSEYAVAKGPQAGFIEVTDDEMLSAILSKHPNLNLLTWDEKVDTLKARLKNPKILVKGASLCIAR